MDDQKPPKDPDKPEGTETEDPPQTPDIQEIPPEQIDPQPIYARTVLWANLYVIALGPGMPGIAAVLASDKNGDVVAVQFLVEADAGNISLEQVVKEGWTVPAKGFRNFRMLVERIAQDMGATPSRIVAPPGGLGMH